MNLPRSPPRGTHTSPLPPPRGGLAALKGTDHGPPQVHPRRRLRGPIHCDCCNDTSPRGTARGRRARQRARAALRGTVRAREKRASAQDGGE